jgi:hypothetical protein
MGDVDALTGRYRLPCPASGSCGVRLSSFRELERLPGAAHPAVFRVAFACACGDEHTALVAHDALDWAPLGLAEERSYLNLMTSRASRYAMKNANRIGLKTPRSAYKRPPTTSAHARAIQSRLRT